MFNLGHAIKQHLLQDENIQNQIGTKIYNEVVVTTSNSVEAPYLIVYIDSISPVYTKDIFTYWEASFSVVLLTNKYSELSGYSELINDSLALKSIETDLLEIDTIRLDNYSENSESDFQLYSSNLKFSCKFLNK